MTVYVEPPPNTPIAWQSQIGAQAYTFVAIRVQGAGWYVSGRFTEPLRWVDLCACLPPVDGRFLLLGVVGQVTPALSTYPNGVNAPA